MKKINLIEMLQGCSKRNGTTFRQSNPDGQTTVNRQSRLMLHRGYLRNLTMIFAVLTLSIANIGTAWGETVTWDFTNRSAATLANGSSYSYMATDGTTEMRYSAGSSDAIVAKAKTTDGYLKENGKTGSATVKDIDGKTDLGKTRLIRLFVSGKGTLQINCNGTNGTYKVLNGSASGSVLVSSLSANTTSSEINVTTSPIWIETTTKGYINSIVWTPSTGSTWFVKGGWNSWGTTDNLTGSGTELSATVNITTVGKYEFKIFDSTSSGTWWGNGGNIGCNVSGWTFESPGSNCTFFASETGNYTFTFNTSTKKLSVTYPTAQGKYYYKNTGSWSNVAIYRYVGDKNNGWPGSIVVETEEICGDTYFVTYADPGTTLIFNNNNNGSQTGNMAASGNAGKYVQGTEDSWRTFPTYTVTYDGNEKTGGNVPTDGSSPYACGSTVTVLGNTGSLVKTGYNFIGWNTAANGSGTSYTAGNTFTISANTTLYAQWELIPTYDITYNANGGTGTTASQTGNLSGAVVATNANGFTRSGYKFKWWNTASDGSGEDFYPGENVTIASSNVALYAQWEQVAANQEFWTPIDEATKVTGVAITKTAGDMSITSGGATDAADINVDVNASAAVVNKYNRSVEKHAKVLAIKANDKYIEIHFTDGSPINKLWLGATPANADSKNIVVVYSATSDFTTAGGAAHEFKKVGSTDKLVALPGNTQATKSVTDVSPSTENTYYYARIYRRITTANTVFDNTTNLGSGTIVRIYSIKAQKGLACVAPTTVNITGTYHYFPGETISLTAAAEGGSGTPTTYQWYKGGTADGNIIEGATSATYTKENCTFADAGSYYCKVTRGGSCSKFSGNYDVKILHLYVKTGRNGTAYGDVDFVKVDATTARATISLGANWDYGFNIADGCGHHYGNTGSMNESDCTGWTMNVDGTDCLMRTTNGAIYTFTVDYTTLTAPVVSITYPSANQAADKVIYFDNNDRNWSTLHYRIGRANHTQATPMTKVSGTANLYKVNTAAYDNFSGWHIANNAGWTGDNNSIYRTYTEGDEYSITYATAHEGGAVTESAVTVTPTTSRGNGSDEGINNNCEFYNYTITNGMKTDNVSITAPSNGTISVAYTDVAGESQSFTSGNRDLAHTVIITPTATPAEGYTLSGLTVNGAAHTSGTTYTVTANTTIAATFSPASYTITYKDQGNVAFSGEHAAGHPTTHTYGSATTLKTASKTGYTFGGWYTSSDCSTGLVTSLGATAYTADITLYAKWTVNSSSECITITHWGTSNATTEAWAGSIADENKYKLAQSGSGTSNNKSTDSNASICLYYGTTMSIYDSPTTTTDFANVTSVSFKVKLYNASKKPTITVSVGSDSGETVTLSENTDKSTFKTYTVNFGKQLTGAVKFKNNGSGDSGYKVYLDDIEICTASMSSCTTPVIPTLSNQSLCEGADIAPWNATVTNASAISAAGETVTYSWKKKGNDTELANTASFDLGASAAESQGGTYVVTVTVSKTGYASSTATKEVTLSVTDGIEVTGITADKATVYPTNSVTLTATASATATWQWYTCSNAEGADESIISGATSASYTIASAGSAGTYYYKVKATGSCGTDEMVYTLTVSAAAGGDCETEFWFAYDSDRPEGAAAATHITTALTAGSTASASITIDGNTYAITKRSSNSTGPVTIVIPEGNTGTVYVLINGSNSRSLTLTKGGVSQWSEVPVGWTSYSITGLDEGTYTLSGSGNLGWGLVALKLCSAVACTDPEVTASVNNSTACVGSSVTFTATGAHASANYQWQKYSGGAWTDIADAKAATYNIASVVTTDALKYRVIATNACDRTSNEVTLSVPVAPVFGSFTATRSVMATQALSITDVEASDATSYAWYKSADATYDAGSDTKVGTTQELLLASGGEAAGATYYLFCVASNACGSTTSSAITVNVTALVEEDCATRGTEGAAEFGFQNSGCSQGTYNGTAVWSTGTSNSKILIYSAPDGKYFKTMKVTIASSSASKASYNWSIDGGSSYTDDGVAITGVTTTLTEKTIDLSAHGNVNEVKIGRNFGNGESSGTLYLSKICFEYTESCTATTVTPSVPSKTHTIGESFSAPTFTLGPDAVSSGTLTYSSSDEEIASVDESGNVTFNGTAGTVTITAAYAGGTVSTTDYCASEGSYTITVSCSGGAPKIVAAGSVNMSGCNSSVTLNAKTQAGADFAGGSYQWFHNGVEIEGATSKSYTAIQTGVYTVAYTSAGGCTSLSTNNATVTSTTVEPEVTKLVPFQYYHVDKTYTAQMKDRHLFSVKGSEAYGSTGKNFKLTMSRNGGAETDMTTAASIWVKRSDDGQVDTVMIDLNKLSGKYSAGDELVLTCAAVDCSGKVSAVYKDEITINVIGATPTLALICSGSNKASGTRKTSELTVGGDFLTGYNVADLCQQTGNTTFDANTEWGLYTRLKENYIVTPVNGYAVFNKLNYEPFDILLLTDYPKASKSDAAKDVLDDMAALCDYRPMLSFKAHMVAKTPSKWAAKGFTTSPVVPKNTRTRLNIVCYAHPMFSTLKSTATHIQKDNDDPSQIVYTMLTGAGYESSKGLQGFELEAAENFVVIGLTHYNATPEDGTPSAGLVTWTPGSEDRMLVTAVERQENLEARMIMFAVNCGAQSKFTETGHNVVLKCLEYLLDDNPLHVADCSFTFDNGAGNSMDAAAQATACPSCTGTKGDGKWSTAANWGPDYVVRPGKDTEVKIAAPVTVDPAVGDGAATSFTPKVRSVRILEGGQVEIPAGSYLEVVSTIRRQNGNDIYPTEENDIHIGSSETGNGTLILNNSTEDTKAQVDMYSKGFIDDGGVKNYQYIGTPFVEVNALYNYYGSWIYSWGVKKNGNWGWVAVKNGGPMTAWTGYCITQEAPTYHQMSGTLTATGTKDIVVPAGQNMVVGNSWTAPIDISKFATTDFENLDANIYFFNTGVDKTGTAGAAGSRYAGSTYVTVPINSAPYTEDDHIPSLQGFFVKNTSSSEGTLHLDYDKHVRGSSRAGRLSEGMHAPARRAAFSSDEPTVLKIKVSGENYDDKLLLLAREDFTTGFDNGWDGDKWDGNASALYIYTTDSEGTENSVSAVPELEGTIIGFRAGEDDAYTLNFEYLNSDEPLYLYDVENNTYTQIMTGMTYRFFTTDNEKHERFIITRSNGQEVATGVEPVSGSLDRSKAKKLLIKDKMFIMVNGMLYDATGKVVK